MKLDFKLIITFFLCLFFGLIKSTSLRTFFPNKAFSLKTEENILSETENEIIINIKDEIINNYTRIVGKNGIISFVTDYNSTLFDDYSSDIEEKITFETTITDDSNQEYKISCRFWKPKQDFLRLFCALQEDMSLEAKYINFNETAFEYDNKYQITVKSEIKDTPVIIIDQIVPFIYSDFQEINVTTDKDTYDLIFEYENYNSEILTLNKGGRSKLILSNCQTFGKELKCSITKAEIEKILVKDVDNFTFGILNEYYGFYFLEDVSGVSIIYKNVAKKKDIILEITKLKVVSTEIGRYITYETNISSINDIITDYFSLNFTGYEENQSKCLFKKSENTNLLLLCSFETSGTFFLEQKNYSIQLNDINILYNFIIESINNNETFTILNAYGQVFDNVYPQKLDLIRNDLIYIFFIYQSDVIPYEKIKFNPDSENLECKSLKNMAKCLVTLSRFKNKELGYYNLYYINLKNSLSIVTEISEFKIFLPIITMNIKSKDNENSIKIGQNGTLYFITNFNDNETNIFDSKDIEEKYTFKSEIYDEENNNYDVNCRLWNPINEKIVIICKLENNLKYQEQNITLNNITLNFDKFYINIISETSLKIYQLNYTIPFLYSDKQIIEIIDDKETYLFKFKYDSYYDDLLYIHGKRYNYAVLDNCYINKTELICEITKEKILETLIANNEVFTLGTLNNNVGSILFNLSYSIVINHEISKKEDIYIDITNLLVNKVKAFGTFAFETNISSIPNLISDNFSNPYLFLFSFGYFKKTNFNNLLLIFESSFNNIATKLGKIYREIVFENIHYKYNFRIQPVSNNQIVSFYLMRAGKFDLVYPPILNFTNEKSITLYYKTESPNYISNLKLNLNSSSELECENLSGMKKCIVPKSHFHDRRTGNYYTQYLTYSDDYSIYYEINPFIVILPIDYNPIFSINKENNNNIINIGINGTLYFITNYTGALIFDPNDIEEKTLFNTTIFDEEENNYNVFCRLWNPTKEKLVIICNLYEKLKYNEQYITLNNVLLNYSEYNISIISETSVKVNQLNYIIPFIYSNKQTINANDNTQTYELKFKYELYNNDSLYIKGTQNEYALLENCQAKEKEKEIICQLSRLKIESILTYNNEPFSLGCLNDNFGQLSFHVVHNININYDIDFEESVYVYIKYTLENVAESGSSFAYETDTGTTTTTKLTTKIFPMKFNEGEINCKFKKTNINSNLLLICMPNKTGEIYLEELDETIYLYNIHYRYEFIIKNIDTNKEKIYINDFGTLVGLVFPDVLNYTLEEDNITITYLMPSPSLSKNIKLNPYSSSYLECNDLQGMKKCVVPLSHFKNGNSGYQYTYHLNYFGGYSIYYDSNPIYVEFPLRQIKIEIEDKDNTQIIKLGNMYRYLNFITNYIDNDNIFREFELESFNFMANFSNSIDNKIIEANCKFWNPINEKMRIICELYENFENEEQIIYMNDINFIYNKDNNITIIFNAKNIKVKQLNSRFSFIYSNKQEINIENDINTNNLEFILKYYDNSPLYLYGNDMRAVRLDNCEANYRNEKLKCKINKDKLLEILSYNREKFKIGEKHESEGLYIFNSVLDIKVNYNIIQKEIQLNIGNLLTKEAAMNEFIAYETNSNITKLDIFTSDYFEIESNKNDKIKCIFKKVINYDNLLLLCNATNEGKSYLGKIITNTYDNINIKYKFIIEESENKEEFNISGEGTKISSVSPLELNFTFEDSFIIKYETESPEKLTGIMLNKNSSSELNCENKIWYKECIVDKSHFSKSGYYYTYHTNNNKTKTISYEVPPIKVFIEEETPGVLTDIPTDVPTDNNNNNNGSKNNNDNLGIIVGVSIAAGIILLCLIGFFVWHYLRKKNQNDINFSKGTEDIELKAPISSDAKD